MKNGLYQVKAINTDYSVSTYGRIFWFIYGWTTTEDEVLAGTCGNLVAGDIVMIPVDSKYPASAPSRMPLKHLVFIKDMEGTDAQ